MPFEPEEIDDPDGTVPEPMDQEEQAEIRDQQQDTLDQTTAGVGDSDRALGYEEPYRDEN